MAVLGSTIGLAGPPADRLGDPLPAGAVARLGTVRLRHGDQVNTVAFSPDGRTIASGARDGSLALWDAGTGAEVRYGPPRGIVFALAYSPDGRTLAVAGRKGVRLVGVVSGKESRLATEGDVTAVAFSPDGTRLVTGGTDRRSPSGSDRPGRRCARSRGTRTR
jgi:WD40 repeat protein